MNIPPRKNEWQIAEVLADQHALFMLWGIKEKIFSQSEEFVANYGDDFPIGEIISRLEAEGFIRLDGERMVLTDKGNLVLNYFENDGNSPEYPSNVEYDSQVKLKQNERVDIYTFSEFMLLVAKNEIENKRLPSAEKAIMYGLFHATSDAQAEPLRDLYDSITFERHLKLRGIELNNREIQMSISGKAVSSNLILYKEFSKRAQGAEKLIYRTVERKRNLPYRDRGETYRSVRDYFGLYMSTSREGSYSVTFRLGEPTNQQLLPGFDDTSDILEELIVCLGFLNEGEDEMLRQHIENTAYYRNFVGLVKSIAPDGDNVRQVGFTISDNREIRGVAFTREASEIAIPIETHNTQYPTSLETITGELRYADDLYQGRLKIVVKGGKPLDVIVMSGMSDIVRPFFGSLVTIKGYRKERDLVLTEISDANENET